MYKMVDELLVNLVTGWASSALVFYGCAMGGEYVAFYLISQAMLSIA